MRLTPRLIGGSSTNTCVLGRQPPTDLSGTSGTLLNAGFFEGFGEPSSGDRDLWRVERAGRVTREDVAASGSRLGDLDRPRTVEGPGTDEFPRVLDDAARVERVRDGAGDWDSVDLATVRPRGAAAAG